MKSEEAQSFCEEDKDVLEAALEKNGDPNAYSKSGKSMLAVAIKRRNWRAMQCLLKKGADPNKKDAKPRSIAPDLREMSHEVDYPPPLFYALGENNEQAVKLLLLHGANATSTCWGLSALHYACLARNFEAVKMLIKAGANLNDPCSIGRQTPLHLALVSQDDERIACHLIASGADFEVEDDTLQKPLHIAAKNACLKAVKLMLERGAKVNAVDDFGCNPLLALIADGLPQVWSLLTKCRRERRLLFYMDEMTKLEKETCSMMKSYVDIVELLLQRGANPNSRGNIFNNSTTSLLLACGEFTNTKTDDCSYSMNLGSIHEIHYKKKIPAETEVFKGLKEIVLLLLEHGADVKIVDSNRLNAMHIATKNFKEDSIPILKVLLKYGIPVDEPNQLNETCLSYAVKYKTYDLIKFLLENGASPYRRIQESLSPFQIAINVTKNKEVIKMILQHELDYYIVPGLWESLTQINWQESELVYMLLRHLSYQGLDFNHDVFKNELKRQEHYTFYLNCLEEAKNMQRDIIYGNISIYDISRCRNIKKLSLLARNNDLVQAFHTSSYRLKYPFHINRLQQKMIKAQELANLRGGAVKVLEKICNNRLPNHVHDRILDYLDNKDLHMLKCICSKEQTKSYINTAYKPYGLNAELTNVQKMLNVSSILDLQMLRIKNLWQINM